MSRSHVLFYLYPTSPAAQEVLNDPDNRYLVDRSGLSPCFAIGHFQSKCGRRETLVTIGRLGDIVLRSTSFSREQCSFEIDPNTQVIMFRDTSKGGTSSVLGDKSKPFRPGQLRKVVVQRDLNEYIGMGGEKRNIVMFRLQWPYEPPRTMEMVEARDVKALAVNPRFALTVSDNIETAVPTMPQTRIHTALPKKDMIRWAKIDALGSGAFGKVYRAVDVDTGRLIAVKIVKIRKDDKQAFAYLKREIEAIGRIEHPFVVDYVCSQASINDANAQVVMGLMEGSLYSALSGKKRDTERLNAIAKIMLSHMLQALDCVASMGIIHRDVKPENILYCHGPNRELVFKLGDFGLCNDISVAQTISGTPIYMAPEQWTKEGQSSKADIWSLFVVLVWLYDIKGFRRYAYGREATREKIVQRVMDAAAPGPGKFLHQLTEMARRRPDKRASAAQMMLKLGLFSKEPRAILCSHDKDPGKIPAMPGDDPLFPALQKFTLGRRTRDTRS